ncbi:hypothetical protein LTR86_008649 [Recurvomyces mirabilis]|nr:hypothetical protein LTR86_008649 [Recurvomyces mirabilis]
MAEASSSRVHDEILNPQQSLSRHESRHSTSTASRRHSYYEAQRTGQRPRPLSSSSQTTTRSKGKGASYQQPRDFDNIGEANVASAVDSNDYDVLEFGQARPQSISNLDANLARAGGGSVRRRPSGRQTQSGLTEEAIPPPIAQSREPPGTSSTTVKPKSLEDTEAGEAHDADDEDSESGAPSPFVSRRPEDFIASHQEAAPSTPRWLTELYTISYLIFFSILGTLARLGLQWLTFYPGAPIVTPVVWANFAGSMFMGFLAEDQGLFRDDWADYSAAREKEGQDLAALHKAERLKRKKAIPMYIGLATGFCGSLTSFSSFARDSFLGLSNNLPTPLNHQADYNANTLTTGSSASRHGGYSFEAWAAVVLTTLALSLGGLIVGAHLALAFDRITPRIHTPITCRLIDPLMVFLGFGCWLGAVFLTIWPPHQTWRGEVLFALVFAPAGCLLRFYASQKLNGLVAVFPLGTFAVNMLGTAIEGMCYDVQHVGVGIMGMTGGGRIGCQVLQGVQDGFCGCLTTVSTWVSEINGLKRRHGYVYAFASVIGALCLMVVIMGSVRWTVGYSTPVCNVGYPNKIYG